jgi:hypothetical protein
VGALGGVVFRLLMLVHGFVPAWTGSPPHYPFGIRSDFLLGLRHVPTELLTEWMTAPVAMGMIFLTFLLLLRVVLRIQWLAVAALFVLTSFTSGIDFDHFWVDITLSAVGNALMLFILLRFGLFALMVYQFFWLVGEHIYTLDPSRLYSGVSYFALILVVAVAAYGCYISLAGRSMFKDPLFQD